MKASPRKNIRSVLAASVVAMALAGLACGTAATATPSAKSIPAPIAAPAPGAPVAPAPTATPKPAPVPVVADREVVLAVSRDLANGEQDPYYAHSSLMVWESLVALDNQLAAIPQLTESWRLSDDALAWTFKLRQGISFTDGTSFDADTVVANIERFKKISPRPSPFFTFTVRRAYGGDLAGASRVDDHTVLFQLNTPNPSMVFTMSNFFSAMFSPKSFAANGDFSGIPAATGPFKLIEWKKDQFMLLERNEGYWGKKPYVRRIRVRVIPDSGARVSALLAKEVDGVVEWGALAPAEARSLEGKPGITVGADPISQTHYLAFNTSKPPFDNVELRQAVALAVNREAIVKSLVLGYGVPGQTLLSPFSPQWLSPKGRPTYDPARAQALARSVLGDTRVRATLLFRGGAGPVGIWKAIAELLQSDLVKLGVDLELVPLEQAAQTARETSGDWNLRVTSPSWPNGDPDFLMDRFLSSKGEFNFDRKAGYRNAEVDVLVAAGKAERDPRKRFETYERLQEIAARDVPVTPLYHEYGLYAYRDTISGMRQRIIYQPTLDEMRLVK